jgi:hypothetical protein
VGFVHVIGGEADTDGAAHGPRSCRFQGDDDVVAAGCKFDPASTVGGGAMAQDTETERVDLSGGGCVLVLNRDADGADTGDHIHSALPYASEPGVVSCSPVSSQVFSPERIIGQPP